jgi:hypothetical protein
MGEPPLALSGDGGRLRCWLRGLASSRGSVEKLGRLLVQASPSTPLEDKEPLGAVRSNRGAPAEQHSTPLRPLHSITRGMMEIFYLASRRGCGVPASDAAAAAAPGVSTVRSHSATSSVLRAPALVTCEGRWERR